MKINFPTFGEMGRIAVSGAAVAAAGMGLISLDINDSYDSQTQAYEDVKMDSDVFECQRGKSLDIINPPKPSLFDALSRMNTHSETVQRFVCDDGRVLEYNLGEGTKNIKHPIPKSLSVPNSGFDTLSKTVKIEDIALSTIFTKWYDIFGKSK